MSSEHSPQEPTLSELDIQIMQAWIPDPNNPPSHVVNTLEAILDPNFRDHRTDTQVLDRLEDIGDLASLQPQADYYSLDRKDRRTYRSVSDIWSRVVDAALIENAAWNEHHVRTHEYKTGLLNKDGLYENLDKWTDLPEQTLVITIDCRKFKTINDRLGHEKGDDILKEVSDILQRSFRGIEFSEERDIREPDIVARADSDTAVEARTGGDEFVVGVLMGNDKTVGEYLDIFNDRIQQNMKTLFDVYQDWTIEAFGFGLTMGAAVRKPKESIESVIHRSDLAQYENKEQQNEGAVGQVSKILLAKD